MGLAKCEHQVFGASFLFLPFGRRSAAQRIANFRQLIVLFPGILHDGGHTHRNDTRIVLQFLADGAHREIGLALRFANPNR